MLKKLFIALCVMIALLVVGVLLLTMFLDKEKLLAAASEKLQQETGARLEVRGDINLSFYPDIGVSLSDASITMPDHAGPDLDVGSLQIGVQLRPLLDREIAIDSIALGDIVVRMTSAPDTEKVDTSDMTNAELDAFYENRRRARDEAGRAAGAEAALAAPLALNISELTVNDARLELLDAEGGTSVIELVALNAQNLNIEGSPIPLAITLRIPGGQPLDVRLTGDVRVALEDQVVHLDAMKVDLRGATPERVDLVLSGPVHFSRLVADLALSLKTGPVVGEGKLRYASYESPQIDANLRMNLLDPALLVLAGPEAAESSTSAAGDGALPLDAIRAIDTRAVLRIDEARFGDHSVLELAAKLRAVGGVVTLGTLTGQVHGGRLDATASFDGRHNTARLETRGEVTDLDIATAVKAAKSTAPISGSASLVWQLRSSGRTVDDLLRALQGPVKLDTEAITLAGTNVERMLCETVALANQKQLTEPFGRDTRFETLSADLQLADGKAVLQPLQARLPNLGLSGKGSFDLTSGDLEARFKAKMDTTIEDLDPACNISRRLAAVEFPINCRGNTAGDPAQWCMVDAEQILKDLAVNEGRKKLEKEANKFLGKLLQKQKRKKEKKAAPEAQ